MRRGGKGTEAFGPSELRSFIEGRGGAIRVGYAGTGHQTYVMPDGTLVPVPGHGSIVTTLVGARVAEQLGMTRRELYEAMGRPMPKQGKVKRGLTVAKAPTPSRKDVVASLDEVMELAKAVRGTLTGQRDPEHYRRLLECVASAKHDLRAAAAAAGVAA